MGMYCGECDSRIHVSDYPKKTCNECTECNEVGCFCDLTKWHLENPKINGEYITIETSSSSGGDRWVTERGFKNGKWVGLKQTDPYDDIEWVVLWIEKEAYEKLSKKRSN